MLVLAASVFLSGCVAIPGYRFEGGRWVFIQSDAGDWRRVMVVDGADAATFRKLSFRYAADKNFAYSQSQRIPNAHGPSFRPLTGEYWRDDRRVFVATSEVGGADPETFRPLAISPWARDAKDAYRGSVAVGAEDVGSFEAINFYWARDAKAYYSMHGFRVVKVPCDYDSMKVLNRGYAKDKARVFWHARVIEGADVATFEVVSNISARDRNRRYSLGDPQPARR